MFYETYLNFWVLSLADFWYHHRCNKPCHRNFFSVLLMPLHHVNFAGCVILSVAWLLSPSPHCLFLFTMFFVIWILARPLAAVLSFTICFCGRWWRACRIRHWLCSCRFLARFLGRSTFDRVIFGSSVGLSLVWVSLRGYSFWLLNPSFLLALQFGCFFAACCLVCGIATAWELLRWLCLGLVRLVGWKVDLQYAFTIVGLQRGDYSYLLICLLGYTDDILAVSARLKWHGVACIALSLLARISSTT